MLQIKKYQVYISTREMVSGAQRGSGWGGTLHPHSNRSTVKSPGEGTIRERPGHSTYLREYVFIYNVQGVRKRRFFLSPTKLNKVKTC